MNNVSRLQVAKSTRRQASEWVVLLTSGEATVHDRAQCKAWLRQHPGHQAAFDEVNGTWGRLSVMGDHARHTAVGDPDPDAVIKYLARSANGSGHRRRIAWRMAAASLLVTAVVGTLMYPYEAGTRYRTAVGQQKTITLPDRSTVELNTDTELRVAYTDKVRHVQLRRGEAYFDVARDVERPFVVQAGLGEIRAVGTGFAVQLKQNEIVAVTVTDGVVEVTHGTGGKTAVSMPDSEASEPQAPMVSRGQRVEYDRRIGRPAAVPPEELDRKLAWRHGMLIFDGQTLDEVIREVGRYTDTKLIVADSELRTLRIGGAFRAGDVDALLEVLDKSFNIDIQRNNPQNVVLSMASAAPAR